MPACIEVPVGARVRGKRGLKLAAWLLGRLRVETKVGNGKWQRMPLQLDIVARTKEG